MKSLAVLLIVFALAGPAFAELPQSTFGQQLPQNTFTAACDCAVTGICTCGPSCDCDDGQVIFGKCKAKKAARQEAKQQNAQATYQAYVTPQTYQQQLPQVSPVWQEWQNGWSKNLATGEWKHGNYGLWPASTTWGNCESHAAYQYVPVVSYQQPMFQFYGGFGGGACAGGG